MSTINNNQTINPHMKLAPLKRRVIEPPAIYSYSLAEDLKASEIEHREMIKSMNKSQLAKITENYPNLKSNIWGVIKYTLGVTSICCGWRYRHSIPLITGICKKPQKTPPHFMEDVKKIWKKFST